MALQIALPAAGFGVSNIVALLSKALERRAAYRAAYAELAMLTDRELADIGIARADIDTIARQAADAV